MKRGIRTDVWQHTSTHTRAINLLWSCMVTKWWKNLPAKPDSDKIVSSRPSVGWGKKAKNPYKTHTSQPWLQRSIQPGNQVEQTAHSYTLVMGSKDEKRYVYKLIIFGLTQQPIRREGKRKGWLWSPHKSTSEVMFTIGKGKKTRPCEWVLADQTQKNVSTRKDCLI